MASDTVREGLAKLLDRWTGHPIDGAVDAILALYIVLTPAELEAKLAEEREACALEVDRWAAAYPETVFLPVSDDDWKNVNAILEQHWGRPIDVVTGAMGRFFSSKIAAAIRERP